MVNGNNPIEWVVAHQNKAQMLNRSLQRIIQLYTDKAHFIYELLQNAEDACATKIKFIQHEDSLEVIHDGTPFTKENLSSLCDIGNSKKVGDLNKIGEFGVGFKSVFGICKDVKLYSRPITKDSDFPKIACEIQNFVDPREIPFEMIPETYTTRFIFPYHVGSDFSGFSKLENLRNAISSKLTKLEATTLLFMKHLRQIEYEIEGKGVRNEGCYSLTRNAINDHCEEITTEGGDKAFSYLVFSRNTNKANRSVDIAIPYQKDTTGKYNFCETNNPYVSVYFPTEKESKLDFIVQGPFRTTPNRGSIPEDNEENKELVQLLAELLKDSLLELRNRDILTIDLLRLMPVYKERFGEGSSLFLPLCTQVLELLKTESILPCKDGGYTTCTNARISRGKELANHLDNAKLTSLINEDNCNISWLSTELTDTSSTFHDLYRVLKNEIGIIEIRPEDLGKLINDNPNFMPQMTNQWIIGLYNNIFYKVAGAFANNGTDNLLNAPIVKILDGSFERAYENRTPNVYLYSDGTDSQTDFKIVDKELCKECSDFLKNVVHLNVPDEYDCFLQGVEKRYKDYNTKPPSDEQHIQDIKTVLKYEKTHPNVKEDLKKVDFGLLFDMSGKKTYLSISLIEEINSSSAQYLSTPSLCLSKTKNKINLREYTQDCSALLVLSDLYERNGICESDLIDFGLRESIVFDAEKVSGKFDKSSKDILPSYCEDSKNSVPGCRGKDNYRPWLTLKGIEAVLSFIMKNPDSPNSVAKSKIIWDHLLQYERHLHGYLEVNGSSGHIPEHDCMLLKILKPTNEKIQELLKSENPWDGRWLYDKNKKLVSQKEISKDELNTNIYGEIDSNSKIYQWLGFKENSTSILESIENLINQLPNGDLEKGALQKAIQQIHNRTIHGFPTRKVNDWNRIKVHAAKELFFADPVKYEAKIRLVRTSLKPDSYRSYLKNMYGIESTNNVACQLCHQERNSFEGSQLLDQLPKEISQLHLCLCPNCTRVFQNVRKDGNQLNEMLKQIKNLSQTEITSVDHIDIPIDQDNTLWFTQVHVAEIQEILKLVDDD